MVFIPRKNLKRTKIFCIHSLVLITILVLSGYDLVKSHRNVVTTFEKIPPPYSQSSHTCQVNWSETAKLIASDGTSNDWFGISVSIDGNYSVVGARDDDAERGSAYVFQYDGNQWVEDQKLLAADGVAGDWFGISVCILGDFIFVGADADDNENGINAGSVYVFRHSGSSWLQEDRLVASDGTTNDYFGRYVSLAGDSAVIGAYYDNNITGSAYVFKRIGNDWIEEDKLTASDGEPGDYFGVSTSISGEYAFIGAYRDDNVNGIDAGSVYIFKQTSDGWVEEDRVLASDGASFDRFGISTSVDENYMIVGAYYDDAYTGSSYIFKNTATGWVEETKLLASDGEVNDFFGRSVSIDEKYAIIGAWGDIESSGSVYIFKHVDTIWIEENKIVASDGASNDRFGYQVALQGNRAIIGAYQDDNENGIDAGSAYLFTQEAENQPPTPPTITGPVKGKIKVAVDYNFTATDPDNDNLYFFIDWDDGTNSSWFGPSPSGNPITVSHTWSTKGTYTIKAKAKDIFGLESGWGSLSVSMPCAHNLPFKYFWMKLFEQFPRAFPILRHLMG